MQIKKKVTVVASAVAAAAFAVAGVALAGGTANAQEINQGGGSGAGITAGQIAVYGDTISGATINIDPQNCTWNQFGLSDVMYYATVTDTPANGAAPTTIVANQALGQNTGGNSATGGTTISYNASNGVILSGTAGDTITVSVLATYKGTSVTNSTSFKLGTTDVLSNTHGTLSAPVLSSGQAQGTWTAGSQVCVNDATNAPVAAANAKTQYQWFFKPAGQAIAPLTTFNGFTDPAPVNIGATTGNGSCLTLPSAVTTGQIFVVEGITAGTNGGELNIDGGIAGNTSTYSSYLDSSISYPTVANTQNSVSVTPLTNLACDGSPASLPICNNIEGSFGHIIYTAPVGTQLNAVLTNTVPTGSTVAWEWMQNPTSYPTDTNPLTVPAGCTVVATTQDYTPVSTDANTALWAIATVTASNGVSYKQYFNGPAFIVPGAVAPTCTNGRTVVAGTNFRMVEGDKLATTDGSVTLSVVNGQLKAGNNTLGVAGNYYWAFQDDGNVVQYNAATSAVAFATNSRVGGGAGNYIAVQCDGNIVVYPGGNPSPATGLSILHA